MFYSHEVLTSREYGVATVWLIATLGAKSTLKKINKKAILDVDVPQACATIVDPAAPMALRLQSNLLYGVTRVYGEKASYVLLDAQTARDKMQALLATIRKADIDLPHGHKNRRAQLVLQEDSSFVLEDLFNFDMSLSQGLYGDTASQLASRLSSSVEDPAASMSMEPEHEVASPAHIQIPASTSSMIGGGGGFGITGSIHSGSTRLNPPSHSAMYGREEEGLADPDFAFNDDGTMFNVEPRSEHTRTHLSHTPQPDQRRTPLLDNAHEDAVMRGMSHPAEDSLPGAHASAAPLEQADLAAYPEDQAFAEDQQQFVNSELDLSERVIESSESFAVAPARRTRAPKVVALDTELELRNRDLAEWAEDYLATMDNMINTKQARSTALAKKNANYWVLQNGVGSVASTFRDEPAPEALRMFTGNALLQALTGMNLRSTPEKHARDQDSHVPEEGATADNRRVRSRSGEAEFGRGDEDIVLYDAGYAELPEAEMGREAHEALDERLSSQMPWNVSASIRGSSARPASALHYSAGMAATSSTFGGPAGSLRGRGNRLISASPLLGRGTGQQVLADLGDDYLRSDDAEPPGSASHGGSGAHFQHHDLLLSGVPSDDFELYGPAAAVETQATDQPAWLRQVLDTESHNFLDFVKEKISEADDARDSAGAAAMPDEEYPVPEPLGPRATITFEDLLSPESNSTIVAAQALLHVLTLATKNLLRAEQMDAFGAITMRVLG